MSWFLNVKKCDFAKSQLEYLGNIISKDGGACGSQEDRRYGGLAGAEVSEMVESFFLGLTRYYKRFIRRYGWITTPLTTLLEKNAFEWTKEVQEAFEKLKTTMTSPPVFAMPNFFPFIVETYSSGSGLGAVLMQ